VDEGQVQDGEVTRDRFSAELVGSAERRLVRDTHVIGQGCRVALAEIVGRFGQWVLPM
jgi:hypothetical protein